MLDQLEITNGTIELLDAKQHAIVVATEERVECITVALLRAGDELGVGRVGCRQDRETTTR